MKYKNGKIMLKGALMALLAVTLTAGPSLAVELAAVPAQWSPDGGTTQIPMWGFVDLDPDTAAGYVCPGAPVTWNGGPVLNEPAGPLTINVKNCLSEDISVFIPGLAKQLSPVLTTDGQGRERLLSLDYIVDGGITGTYSWTATEGTYLFQSGTDIRTQVPMGLYGALVVTGTGYPTVAQEEVLLFSEIDPALNADPVNFGGARVSKWNPQYFLINGATSPYTTDLNINVSEDVLLRFVNAGLETFVPTLEGGLYMDVIAEDGNLYPYSLTQYGIELQAGKTFDAVINVGSAGTYAIYDRSLHLANGGLVVAIQAAPAVGAPIAIDDPDVSTPAAYTIPEEGSLITSAGGAPAGVLDNDTGGATAAVLVSGPSAGTLTGGLAVDGSFTYEPNADFNGADQFTYVANAGGPNSNVATVDITVTPVNDAPVAVADNETTPVDTATVIDVVANDTDVDGNLNPTSANTACVTCSTPLNGGLVNNSDGTFTYTPGAGYSGPDGFVYEVCDTAPACDTATVTIDVSGVATNIPPVANDDTTSVQRGTTLSGYNIVANDSDPDGTIDWNSVVITTGATAQRGGTVVNNGDGTVDYITPSPGWRGTDTFQYTVNDNDGDTSNAATVRINVVK